jgi:hypothetical protein
VPASCSPQRQKLRFLLSPTHWDRWAGESGVLVRWAVEDTKGGAPKGSVLSQQGSQQRPQALGWLPPGILPGAPSFLPFVSLSP